MTDTIKIRVPVLVFPPEGKVNGIEKQMSGVGEKAIVYQVHIKQSGDAWQPFRELGTDLDANPNAKLYYLTAELAVPESCTVEAGVESKEKPNV
jgi:hypothetical protein